MQVTKETSFQSGMKHGREDGRYLGRRSITILFPNADVTAFTEGMEAGIESRKADAKRAAKELPAVAKPKKSPPKKKLAKSAK